MLMKMAKDVPHCKVVDLELELSPAPGVASITVKFEGPDIRAILDKSHSDDYRP